MKRTLGLTLLLFTVVAAFCFPHLKLDDASAYGSYPVSNRSTGLNYPTIQSAIDASSTSDGNIIFVNKGIYVENITIYKSIMLIGEDRAQTVINGNQTEIVVLITAQRVLVRNFTIRNGIAGVFVDHSNNTRVMDNNVVNCIPHTVREYGFQQGIRVQYSFNCLIQNNLVANNAVAGILVSDSSNFTVSRNRVFSNGLSTSSYGLNANASSYGVISYNDVAENGYDGIGLGNGSRFCTIIGNNITNNNIMNIWVDSGSRDNLIYGNNIIMKWVQAGVANNVLNQWDSGIEGNYWSNHTGTDTNYDGIIDSFYSIYANNTDHFPLSGMLHSYLAYKDQVVDVITDSGVDNLVFSESNSSVKMSVSSIAPDRTEDFCRIRIPHSLMAEPYNVTVDGVEPVYVNYTLKDDGASRWIYLRYSHSAHEIIIDGTQPLDVIPPAVSVLSPEYLVYTQNIVSLILVTDEETSWIGYSLDNVKNVTISGNVTLSELPDGPHELTVYANDTVGNMGRSETIYFTVKTQTEIPFIVWILLAALIIPAVGGLAILAYKRSGKQRGQGKK